MKEKGELFEPDLNHPNTIKEGACITFDAKPLL